MKLLKLAPIILVLVLFTFAIKSCNVQSIVSKITLENGSIPPDFGKDNTPLIVAIVGDKYHDKYSRKFTLKYYSGVHLFVSRHMLSSEIFSNQTKYRFVLDFKKVVTNQQFANGVAYVPYQYFMTDRLTRKTYKLNWRSSQWGKMLKAYLISLERERLKYK